MFVYFKYLRHLTNDLKLWQLLQVCYLSYNRLAIFNIVFFPKIKNYFGLIKNNDDIYRRFGKAGYVEYFPTINKNISLEKIHELVNNSENLIELLVKSNVNLIDF